MQRRCSRPRSPTRRCWPGRNRSGSARSSPRRVLDALVDRQDRHVAGARQAPVVEQRLEIAQHGWAAIGLRRHPVNEVRPWQVELIARDGGARVIEQVFGLISERSLNVGVRSHGFSSTRGTDGPMSGSDSSGVTRSVTAPTLVDRRTGTAGSPATTGSRPSERSRRRIESERRPRPPAGTVGDVVGHRISIRHCVARGHARDLVITVVDRLPGWLLGA